MKDCPTALRIALVLLGGFLGASAVEPARPVESSLRQWAEQDYLLGDWGGVRTDLARRGIDFEVFYAGSLPNNLAGGLQRGGVYQGGLLATLDLDSQKLASLPGGTLHVGGLWLHGQKPFSADFSGDMNRVNLLDFDNAARLWEAWYRQKFYAGRISLKLGQLSVDRDFIVPEYYGSLGDSPLINQTFFYPSLPFNLFDIQGFPERNHGLPATPSAALGAVARWEVSAATFLQAGIYEGDPDTSYAGTDFDLCESKGALLFFEAGYRLNQGTNHSGLEGSYKIGGYYHTGDFADVSDGVNWAFAAQAQFPEPPVHNHHGNFGAYLLAEQQLYRERDKSDPARQGLLGFFRLLGAPADRNLTQLEVDGGLVYRGLIPSRDWDTFALAISYLEISDDIRRAQGDLNQLAPGTFVPADHEAVLELSYKIQATAWWTLQPSLQHVLHPGGSSAIPDATVLILQTTLRF